MPARSHSPSSGSGSGGRPTSTTPSIGGVSCLQSPAAARWWSPGRWWPRSAPLLAAVVLGAAAAALLIIPASRTGRGCAGASQAPHWAASPHGSSSSDAGAARHHQQQQQSSSSASWALPAVSECRVVEGSAELCSWCNATFARRHPLRERFEASYLPGSPCAMPPSLMGKLRRGGRVTINVVGGSMTYGSLCQDGVTEGSGCAWPARLRARLAQLFPAADVAVANRAKPAWSYTDWVKGWPGDLAESDVLIVDLQVNSQTYTWDWVREMEEVDAFLHQALLAAYQQRRHQGVLFVESFRICAAEVDDCNKHCPEARQGYLDFNHTGSPMRYWWCNRWWTMASVERPVVQHYGLPIASYRDAVWPDLSAPSQLLPCMWNGLSHPDMLAHIMVGDVVAYALLRAAEAAEAAAAADQPGDSDSGGGGACGALRRPTRFHPLLPVRAYCGGGGVSMSAERPGGFLPAVNTGCWAFFEDRPGKPGWICQRGLGAPPAAAAPPPAAEAGARLSAAEADAVAAAAGADALAFRVAFGTRPQLEITYLVSYTHMGAARVTLLRDGATVDGAAWTLDAAIDDKFSVPRTTVLYHASAAKAWAGRAHAHQLPDGVGAGEYVLAVALPPSQAATQKFKLLALASC